MKELSLSQLTVEQIQQAIAQYRQKITANPKSAEERANLGDLYVQQKQWQKALKSYREAVTLQPDSPRLHRALAKTLNQLGNDRQAAHHLFKLFKLKADSFTPEQLYQLGQTLTAQVPDKAIACYRGAIDSQTDFFEAYQALGELLATQKKYEPVLEVYRLGVRNNPDDARYYFALAEALAAQEKWLWASKNYQKAAKFDPSVKVYYHWGLALYQLQEYVQAQKRFEQALNLKSDSEIYYHLGLTLHKLQKDSQAEECWQKAIALQDNYEEAYYQLGLLWQNQQQWNKASAVYRQMLSFNPNSAIALNAIGQIYHYLQQYDLAVACYTKAIQNSAEADSIETEAFTSYEAALAANPKVTAIDYFGLAKLFRAKSRFPKAITNYQKSLRLDPYFRDAYIALQYTPISKDKSTDLIEFYRQIVTENPDITIAWGNLGDVLTQQNLVSQAIECYRTGSYQKAIQTYPHLAKLNWQESKKCGPDFIIAGASKSGTSSIYFYLSRHPQILLSHTKEIDFYWQNFDRGIDWYLAHFPTITDQDDFLTGEATPNYLRFPQVAQRIKNTFPQTKIIILLRNPADRAISWHYHKLNTGLTNQDLSTAISEEITRLATVSEAEIVETGYYNPDNILSSLYIYKIRAWVEILGRKQFLFLKSEDFYSDPLGNMAQVFDFLGLPNCPLENYPKVNAGSYNQVDSKLRKTLVDYFAPYNRQLEEYLEIEFNWQ